MLVPAEPVHHAGPVQADDRTEESPVLAVLRDEDEPVGTDDRDEVGPVLDGTQDDDQAGPVLADVRDEGHDDEGDEEDSQICAGKAQSLQASLPPVSENSGRRREFYNWAGRMLDEVA